MKQKKSLEQNKVKLNKEQIEKLKKAKNKTLNENKLVKK